MEADSPAQRDRVREPAVPCREVVAKGDLALARVVAKVAEQETRVWGEATKLEASVAPFREEMVEEKKE